jgi:predicted adenine nucleotide alpha hydrolase (AANH) superfamily ATPase
MWETDRSGDRFYHAPRKETTVFMKLLLHACCGPCLVHPLDALRTEGVDVHVWFFNPNIHPHSEYLRRLAAFQAVAELKSVTLIDAPPPADMEEWLRHVVFRETRRCEICFHLRLEAVAKLAEEQGFDAFSTTLLYSRFQKHDLLKDTAEAVAERFDVPFLYRDWRKGWNDGVRKYRALNLYRQKYCGCVFSEKERAAKIVAAEK